jgi:hypothetical protein
MTAEETCSRSTEALEREVARLKDLLCRVYPYVDDVVGTEELQAELEREVFSELTRRRRVLRQLVPP